MSADIGKHHIALEKKKQSALTKAVKTVKVKGKAIKSKETSEKGIIMLNHVPHGFYENEMRSYFSQFGKVLRIRLARSKKTGRSRGYAFVEFAVAEVAQIAAESMNNYLMFERLIKCEVVSSDVNPRKIFRLKNIREKNYPKLNTREFNRRKENVILTEDESEAVMIQRITKLEEQNKKFAEMGIDYSFPIPGCSSIKTEEQTPGQKLTSEHKKCTSKQKLTPQQKQPTPKQLTPNKERSTTPKQKITSDQLTPKNKKSTPAQTLTPGKQTCTPTQKLTPGKQTCTPTQKLTPGQQKSTPPQIFTPTPGKQKSTPTLKLTPGKQKSTPTLKLTPGKQKSTLTQKLTPTPGKQKSTPTLGQQNLTPTRKLTPGKQKSTATLKLTPGKQKSTPTQKLTPTPGKQKSTPTLKLTPGKQKSTPTQKLTPTPGQQNSTPTLKLTPGKQKSTPKQNVSSVHEGITMQVSSVLGNKISPKKSPTEQKYTKISDDELTNNEELLSNNRGRKRKALTMPKFSPKLLRSKNIVTVDSKVELTANDSDDGESSKIHMQNKSKQRKSIVVDGKKKTPEKSKFSPKLLRSRKSQGPNIPENHEMKKTPGRKEKPDLPKISPKLLRSRKSDASSLTPLAGKSTPAKQKKGGRKSVF